MLFYRFEKDNTRAPSNQLSSVITAVEVDRNVLVVDLDHLVGPCLRIPGQILVGSRPGGCPFSGGMGGGCTSAQIRW